jgi:tetratricopeptide (TPR) repeat protein
MSEEEGREWMILPLDAKLARRQGMPLKVPVPKEEFEGLADAGLTGDKLLGWIKDFFETADVAKDGNWRRRNSEMVSQLEGFVSKQPLWAKAQELFGQNEYAKATATLKRITVMMPDDHAAKMNYANALANQGEHDKAMKQLKQIRDTFSGEPDYHVTVAQMHVALGDTDAAIGECVLALESKPDHLGAMDALAKLGLLSRIYTEPRNAGSLAFVRADALMEFLLGHWDSEPRSAEYYIEQAVYHESENRFEAALEAATRAIAAGGDKPSERAEIGRVAALRNLGKLPDAVAAAKAFLEKNPGSAAMEVELSSCLRRGGDKDGAAAAVDRALKNDPGDQEAICLKYWPDDRGDLMQVSKCLDALDAHAKAHPDSAGAWRSLARAKLVCGADEEALGLFEKAVALAPGDDDLRSEWWAELATKTQYQKIIDDSQKVDDLVKRDWKLRWNEAEAYRGLGRMMEARAVYMQINADDSLHVDVRKRAKRAAGEMGGLPGAGAPPA